MKLRIFYISLIIGILGAFWTACDKVGEPLVLVNQQSTTNDLLDSIYIIDSVKVNTKHVLLEEFTGHKCVNCAGASIAAHELSESLDHKLIIYGIHAGYYAEPDPTGEYTADFRTEVGDDLNAFYQVLANPIALINRVEYSGSVLIGEGNWEAAVTEEINKENVVDLKVTNIYYPNIDTLQIKINTTFQQEMAGTYNLVVYIAEDHIISPQKNNEEAVGPTPDWLDYEHRNILRDGITTTYGNKISDNITSGSSFDFNFTYVPSEDWVVGNCNIISYVINAETLEVLQVAELGIKTE
jgi:hypothetical protein